MSFKRLDLLLNMNSILPFLFIFLYYTTCIDVKNKKVPVPWIGILTYRPDDQSPEEVTHIVMIENRITIANAKDVASVKWESLKEFGKATFYDGDTPWNVGLVGRLLHPEYEQGFVNTVAIVFLDIGIDPHLWNPIKVMTDTKKFNKWSKIFNIGYTDRNKILEQEMVPMEYVSRSTCQDFYAQEEINFDFLWPPNPLCFRVTNAKETCVNNGGMVLASNFIDDWILMGLSTYGPGCSLPARYIEILPYVSWIKEHTEVRKATRRSSSYIEAIATQPSYKPFDEVFFASAKDDYRYRLYPAYANITEVVEGCYYAEDNKTLMYKEEDVFTTLSPVAYGMYGIMIVDTNFAQRTCVKIYTRCVARSYYYYQILYGQAHPEETPMYGKSVPSRVRDIGTNESYMVITDPKPITGLDTYFLEFKFQFSYTALVNVSIFGKYNGTAEV